MKTLAIGAIKAYQKFFSPRREFGGGEMMCIYYPSCSQYAIDAIKNAGFLKGALYTLLRVARCHPGREPRVDYFLGSALDRETS